MNANLRTRPAMHTIDLNCDLGEGCGSDAAIVPLISSANVSCGAHAGDDATIAETLRLCATHGVTVGAHPGYADREHFGRRETGQSPQEISTLLREQIERFLALAGAQGIAVRHVKLHGAFYNRAARDVEVAAAVARTVQRIDPALRLVGLSGSEMLNIARTLGMRVAHEVFPDRGYDPEGRLLPRERDGAVIASPEAVAERAFLLAALGLTRDERGRPLMLRADTLCMHGDRADAVAVAQAVRARLQRFDVAVVALD
ncbi:MAG: 5-oxoprolinase subunit PxpA [Pseudomonadota bacterium]